MNAISTFIKETPKSSLVPLLCKDTARDGWLQPESRPTPRTQPCWHPDLGLLAFRTMRYKFILFISHPVYLFCYNLLNRLKYYAIGEMGHLFLKMSHSCIVHLADFFLVQQLFPLSLLFTIYWYLDLDYRIDFFQGHCFWQKYFVGSAVYILLHQSEAHRVWLSHF